MHKDLETFDPDCYREVIKSLCDEIDKACYKALDLTEDDVCDSVNHPAHYTRGGIECLDAIEASLTPEQYRGYLKGNIIKYLWRYEWKNGLEDVEKAQFYLNRLLASLMKETKEKSDE